VSDGNPPQEFGSMFLRGISGSRLISAPIAVEIARLILAEQHGPSSLKQNEPFSVVEDGDTWIVQGAARAAPIVDTGSGLPLEGPFKMQISQFDGQILDCVFVVTIPSAFAAAPPQTKE
jgi:hypothetical protein